MSGRITSLVVLLYTDGLSGVTVHPLLKRVRGYDAASLLRRTDVITTARMGFDLVGRPVRNVDHAAIGLPTRCSLRAEVFIGIPDAPVMLLLERVFGGARGRI